MHPNSIENLYGKPLLCETNTTGAPGVFPRWKNEQEREAAEMKYTGYSSRLEFGNPEGDKTAGKIYFRTDDEMKSYVAGNFNVKIYKPKPH